MLRTRTDRHSAFKSQNAIKRVRKKKVGELRNGQARANTERITLDSHSTLLFSGAARTAN